MIKKILFLITLVVMVVGCTNPTNIPSEKETTVKKETNPQEESSESLDSSSESVPNKDNSIENTENELPPKEETPTEDKKPSSSITLDSWVYNGSNIDEAIKTDFPFIKEGTKFCDLDLNTYYNNLKKCPKEEEYCISWNIHHNKDTIIKDWKSEGSAPVSYTMVYEKDKSTYRLDNRESYTLEVLIESILGLNKNLIIDKPTINGSIHNNDYKTYPKLSFVSYIKDKNYIEFEVLRRLTNNKTNLIYRFELYTKRISFSINENGVLTKLEEYK